MGFVLQILVAVAVAVLWYAALLFHALVWCPLKIARVMRKKGYGGPPISLFHLNNKREVGDIRAKVAGAVANQPAGTVNHDIHSLALPVEHDWEKTYGEKFIFSLSTGAVATFCLPKPEAVAEILAGGTGSFGKCPVTLLDELLGRGGMVLLQDHDEWFRQRTTVRPFFYASQVLENSSIMVAATKEWLEELRGLVMKQGGSAEVDMVVHLGTIARDILCRTAFGADYLKAKDSFESQERLKYLLVKRGRVLPRFLKLTPNKLNNEIRKTHKLVAKSLQQIIDERRNSVRSGRQASFGNDLLGVILNAAESPRSPSQKPLWISKQLPKWTDERVIDQCRTFYFAGQDTIRSSWSWVLIMLSHYTEWQERIRKEVTDVFGTDFSSGGAQFNRLSLLNMFVLETLRMYPAVAKLQRQILRDGATVLGEPLPNGLEVYVDVVKVHRDPEVWGDDAEEFKPERFARGIRAACKHSCGFLPFGSGPRICVAQGQAMTELKLVIAMFLQRFRFRLSPSYRHSPTLLVTLEPGHGVPLILEPLD